MIRILVYEDNPNYRYKIYEYLKSDYEVFITKKFKDVFQILNQTNINLMICDYSTIEIDIKQFIKKVKEINDRTLIMITSSKLGFEDKKKLLKNSIDDFIKKPFDMFELEFRVEHLLKGQTKQYKKFIEIENLKIECDTQTVIYNNEYLSFFNKEFQILYHLFSYPNRIFSKSELVELICNNDKIINENTIRTYINTLRRKIEKITELDIVTVKGVGYKGVIKE